MVLGAGGVVPSILEALNILNIGSVVISNRTKKKAEKEKRNPNNIKEILSHGEKLKSNRQGRTWIIDNRRFYFFNNITIVTSVCAGELVQFKQVQRVGPQELHKRVREVYKKSSNIYPMEYEVVIQQRK